MLDRLQTRNSDDSDAKDTSFQTPVGDGGFLRYAKKPYLLWPLSALLLVYLVGLSASLFPLPLTATVELECHPQETSLSILQKGQARLLQRNRKGNWRLPVGQHTLVFEAPGCETLTCNVSVTKNGEIFEDGRVPLKAVTLHEKRFDFKYRVSPPDSILVVDGKFSEESQSPVKLRPGTYEITFFHPQCKLLFPRPLVISDDTEWETIELSPETGNNSPPEQKREVLALFYAMPPRLWEKYAKFDREDFERHFDRGDYEACREKICDSFLSVCQQIFDEEMEHVGTRMKKSVMDAALLDDGRLPARPFASTANGKSNNRSEWTQLKETAEFLASQNPNRTDIVFRTAVCESRLNGYAQAADVFEQLRSENAISPAEIVLQAECAVLGNENDKAVALCSCIAENQSGDIPSLIKSGTILACLGEKESAVQVFSTAIACDETHVEARILRAALLYRLGRPEDSIPDLDAAEKWNPGLSEILHLRAKAGWDIYRRNTDAANNLELLDRIINDYDMLSGEQ